MITGRIVRNQGKCGDEKNSTHDWENFAEASEFHAKNIDVTASRIVRINQELSELSQPGGSVTIRSAQDLPVTIGPPGLGRFGRNRFLHFVAGGRGLFSKFRDRLKLFCHPRARTHRGDLILLKLNLASDSHCHTRLIIF
jgi:hypothetical protein